MAFDWNDFLSLAEQLAGSEDDASKRTAISRAYYCVFNFAFARAQKTVGRKPRNASYHQWCWDQYTGTNDRACKQLGNTGQRMKARRVRADYKEADIHRLDDEVRRVLEDARWFLGALAVLNSEYPFP